jgi:heptaprenyl diphosphate synthase
VNLDDFAITFGIADLSERMGAVESRIRSVLTNAGPELGIPAWRVASAGGKRLRPLFTIVCAQLGDVFDDKVIDGAAAVELVQVGSLIHDDLFDAALTRRGAPTISAVEGGGHALMAGNWVLAAASELAIGVSAAAASLIADTVAQLCVGQLMEFEELFNIDRSIDSHLSSIRGKTAALFEAACQMGALCGGLSGDETDSIARFGNAFGMGFQVLDDVLDILGDPVKLGKPIGVDVVAGVYTYPVLTALRGPHGDELKGTLSKRNLTEGDDALQAIVTSDGIEAALALSEKFIGEARAAACELSDGRVSTGLRDFPANYAHWALESFTAST